MAGLHRRVKQVTYGIGVNVAFVTQLITKYSESNWRELMRFDIESFHKSLAYVCTEIFVLNEEFEFNN
jgi:hypothetical protein